MKLTIDIPDAMEESLHQQWGANLEQAAKEALAIAWYQAEKLSIGQVAEMLSLSVYDAEGLVKRRSVEAPYSLDDLERDRDTLNRVLQS